MENDTSTKPAKNHSRLAIVVTATLGLVAALLISILFLGPAFLPAKSSVAAKTDQPVVLGTSSSVSDIGSTENTTASPHQQPLGVSDSDRELLASIPGLVSSLGDLTDRASYLDQQISEVRSSVNVIQSKIEALPDHWQSDIRDQLNPVSMELERLSSDLLAIKSIKPPAPVKPVFAPKPVKRKSLSPDFQLINVVDWGNNLLALIKQGDDTLSLSQGDQYQGWRVSDLSMKTGCATFVHSASSSKSKFCIRYGS